MAGVTGMAWRSLAGYAALLAAGTFVLQWLDWRWMVRAHSMAITLALVAAAFLALGLWAGLRAAASRRPAPDAESARAAAAALGLTDRELQVLRGLAEGRSNKQVAQQLGIAPETVKSHVARLYGKLGVSRRTEAVRQARERGILG